MAVAAKATLLVLDGDPVSREEMVRLLTRDGYCVNAAGSAVEGVKLLSEHPAACAIVDVELDDVSGVQAIGMLREVAAQLRVIATAKDNTRDLEARVREQDVVFYYVKGFDREELMEAVALSVAHQQTVHKARILIVDDDVDYQVAVGKVLEAAGYETVHAHTKEEGLEALCRTRPDLVILDIMMTRTTDGFHFLYEMKAAEPGRKPPVLVVSVISQKTAFDFSPTADGDYFPADGFLSKPADLTELVTRVEEFLAAQRQAGRA
jgi:CheY-like chemotaxis protein